MCPRPLCEIGGPRWKTICHIKNYEWQKDCTRCSLPCPGPPWPMSEVFENCCFSAFFDFWPTYRKNILILKMSKVSKLKCACFLQYRLCDLQPPECPRSKKTCFQPITTYENFQVGFLHMARSPRTGEIGGRKHLVHILWHLQFLIGQSIFLLGPPISHGGLGHICRSVTLIFRVREISGFMASLPASL